MSKNVVWWIGVKSEQYSEKYGGWEWLEYSRKTWEYWCKKMMYCLYHLKNQLRKI